MKIIMVILALALSLGCSVQKKTDLGRLGFKEDIESLVQGVPNIHKGALFDRTDMYSYGVSGNTFFYLAISCQAIWNSYPIMESWPVMPLR